MDQWEHKTVVISFPNDAELVTKRANPTWEGITEFSNGSPIVGLENVLDQYGAHGWELVNVVADYSPSFNLSVRQYRAFFRRRKTS